MTRGEVWKVISRFALPLLIGNLLQQLYNVTDSVIVGQFLGKEALAAVSASFFIYYFIISLVIGIGSGTTVVISQFYGAKRFDKLQKAFSSFFIFMLVAGVLLSIIGIIFAEPMFRITNTPEEVIPQAVLYFRIYVCFISGYTWAGRSCSSPSTASSPSCEAWASRSAPCCSSCSPPC